MKSHEYPSGLVLDWDDELQVGDLITTCHEGIWRLDRVEERQGNTPVFHQTRIYDTKGKPSKRLKNACCATYCRKAHIFVCEHIKELEEQLAAFKAML